MENQRYEDARVKFTLKQSMKAERGVPVQIYFLFKFGARQGWVVKAMPRPMYPQK